MANRIVLNTISYHGAGAIAEIPASCSAAATRRSLSAPTPIW